MGTGRIQFTAQGALLPLSNFPAPKRHVSSGTETPQGWILAYDDSSSESCYYTFKVPGDYVSTPVLNIQYSMITADSGDVRWNVNVMCATEDVDDLDTAAADSDNAVNDTIPDVAGERGECSISLTNNDGMAAEDLCILKVEREGGDGGDTATGDAELWLCEFKYTTP